jgi:hypothetical protein
MDAPALRAGAQDRNNYVLKAESGNDAGLFDRVAGRPAITPEAP